jgi:hypothetical protein
MVLAFSFLLRFPDGTSHNVPFAFEVEDATLILNGLCGRNYAQRVLPHIHMVERGEFSSVSIQFDQQRLVEAVICRTTNRATVVVKDILAPGAKIEITATAYIELSGTAETSPEPRLRQTV